MKIAIVGAGIAGLTAAYDLASQGHAVTVFEATSTAGGLASGFRDDRWEWPLERFYHHLFETDTAIKTLVREIGLEDQLFFRRPITAQWWNGHSYALDGVLPILRFPAIPFVDRIRFGMLAAYLKYGTNNWQALEQVTAAQWTSRWGGPHVYREIWRPLLEGKFGAHADEVNMAWLWARLKARSFRLGYFAGGFQAFCDALLARVRQLKVKVYFDAPVAALTPLAGHAWHVTAGGAHEGAAEDVDAVIVTGSPTLLARMAPQLPADYLGRLRELRSMGAVVMTIALKQQLLTDGTYWLMPPKSSFPFLALVEHTNFIEAEHYGGDHLIYCGDYLDPSHEYFSLTPDALLQRFLPSLAKVNPRFEPSWVRAYWLHREPYAQPIVPVNHSRAIPPLATPLPGLYWASMSQVYPWDRGTNFAVELGRRVAAEVSAYEPTLRVRGGGVAMRMQ